MSNQSYDRDCCGCKLSQGLAEPQPPGGVVRLKGDWTVNHYGGGEGFLGWLALQPRFHRTSLSELTAREAQHLGVHIQALDGALNQYWKMRFPNDELQRVYFSYFNESPFDIYPPGAAASCEYHLHMHVIPRTAMRAPLLRRVHRGVDIIDAWHICGEKQQELAEYKRTPGGWPAAIALIDYLRNELDAAWQ